MLDSSGLLSGWSVQFVGVVQVDDRDCVGYGFTDAASDLFGYPSVGQNDDRERCLPACS